jgi:hypothetical protein
MRAHPLDLEQKKIDAAGLGRGMLGEEMFA